MRVQLIETARGIAELQPHWLAVYDADPEASHFMSFDWLFGTPRGAGRGGFVLAVRPSEAIADYMAFLPLRLKTVQGRTGFHNDLNLCGNYNSDYTGILCRRDCEEQAIPALGSALGGMNWRELRLINFAASERRIGLFMEGLPTDLLDCRRLSLVNPDGTDNGICPATILTEDWETFLRERTGSSTRQKIRRFLRKVEGSGTYRITQTDGDTFERDTEILIALWSKRWGAQKGKRLETIQNTMRRMLRNAFETGTLFMPMLWHADRPLCVLAILLDRRKKVFNFYIGGRDGSFKDLPTGLVLHGYAIRHAISLGFRKYDFLRGNEPYKYAFGPEERHIRSLVLRTKTGTNLAGRLDPRCLGEVLRRSRALHASGELAAARNGLAQILDILPHHAPTLYQHGKVSIDLGDFETAIREFGMLVRMDPNAIDARHQLGRAQIKIEDWIGAERTYRDLLGRRRDLPGAWYILGRVLMKLDRPDEADEAFRQASRLDPDIGVAGRMPDHSGHARRKRLPISA